MRALDGEKREVGHQTRFSEHTIGACCFTRESGYSTFAAGKAVTIVYIFFAPLSEGYCILRSTFKEIATSEVRTEPTTF